MRVNWNITIFILNTLYNFRRLLQSLDVDMTAILSNALENAIHAVLKLPEARREIKLDMRLNEEKLLISLKNTYADKPEFMNGLPYTSEGRTRFGTKSIWYVAEKLNGSCQFSVTDTYFILSRYSITHDLRFLSDFAYDKNNKTYPSGGGHMRVCFC